MKFFFAVFILLKFWKLWTDCQKPMLNIFLLKTHKDLLTKSRTQLPMAYYTLLKSYLKNRFFHFKYEVEYSKLREIQAGRKHSESTFECFIYQWYTRSCWKGIAIAFADDTTIFSVARTENEAKYKLQDPLTLVLEWTRKWCIKLNRSKSSHVDFTKKSTLDITYIMELQLK